MIDVQNNLMTAADDDALLVRYVRAGDREALEALLRRHADLAYSTAMHICRHPADAEDAVQTAFVKVMQNAAKYRGASESGVRVWITRIVVGCAKDRIRSEVRRRKWEEQAAGEQYSPFAADDGDGGEVVPAGVLQQALGELPERYRLPILLHHCQGLSVKEAAETLAVPEETLHTRLRRGLQMLKEQVARRGGEGTSLAALAAVLPGLPIHPAPSGLLDRIPGIARGRSRAAALVRQSGTGWLLRAAAVLAVGGGVVAVVRLAAKPDTARSTAIEPTVAPAAPVAVQATPIRYEWNFNEPGLPKAFRVVEGSLVHVQGEGVGGSGCLLASNAVVGLELPLAEFPFVVSYSVTIPEARIKMGYKANSQWLPVRHAEVFYGISEVPGLPVGQFAKKSNARWLTHQDYFTEGWISRWNRSHLQDVIVSRQEADGRVTLMLRPVVFLDNLTIRGLATNELPDVSRYLAALDRLPPAKRRGDCPLPEVKLGAGPANPKQVYVKFTTNIQVNGQANLVE